MLLRKDAPLLLNPSPSFHKYTWLAEFVSQIRHYRRNTIDTTKLAIAARQHLFEPADRERIAFDLEWRGILHVCSNKPEFDAASRVSQLLLEGGPDRCPVPPSEMRAIEPALRGQHYGGFFTPSDSTGDIHKFTRDLAAACERRGVRFVFGAEVCKMLADTDGVVVHWQDGPLRDELKAQRAVICAGIGSRRIASMLGDHVNHDKSRRRREPDGCAACQPARRSSEHPDQSARRRSLPCRRDRRIQWREPRHTLGSNHTFGTLGRAIVSRCVHLAGGALGSVASYDT